MTEIKTLTPDEALKALRRIPLRDLDDGPLVRKMKDPEHGHRMADEILLGLLLYYNQPEIVKAFEELEPKWYS